jgi:diguanylate cyclase (GGDEF)-like protein
MDGSAPMTPVSLRLTATALDRLMPMYLAVDAAGVITGAGVTMARLYPDRPLIGQSLFQLFDLRRFGVITTMAALQACLGQRLLLTPRDGGADLRGLAVPLAGDDGLLLNLSFGIGVIDAVRSHGLTNADFAPTDLAIELMYMVEAKSVISAELERVHSGLRGAKSAAEQRAMTDTLTGLGNRRALDAGLTEIVARRRPFALMHLDLDFFKSVNDRFGHAAGDHVLACVATVLRGATRDGDLVTRVGGDEFVLVLPNPPDAKALLRIATRIIQGLEVPIPFEGQVCEISGSIGIATPQHFDGGDVAALQAVADAALYASKRAGRKRATLAPDPGRGLR